jgi:hypothetical protein
VADNQRQQAKAKAQRMLEAGKSQERVAAKTGLAPKRVERLASQVSAPAAQPKTPSYTGALAQYAAPGGFGAGAYMRAQEAGLTEPEIRAGVEELRKQGMDIGARVETAIKGPGGQFAGGTATDFGSGMNYAFRPVFMPGQEGVGEAGKGVFFAGGPMTSQQVINMLQGKPRETWVLPASTRAPEEGYRAPEGTSYVDVTATPAQQSTQFTAGLDIPRLAAQTTKAAETKAPVSSTKSQSVLQGKRKESARPAARNQLLENYVQRLSGKPATDTDWDWFDRRFPVMSRAFT